MAVTGTILNSLIYDPVWVGTRNLPDSIRAVGGQRSSPDLCFATKLIKIYDQ